MPFASEQETRDLTTYKHEWYIRNRPRLLEKAKEYAKAHPIEIQDYKKQYRERNRETLKTEHREYYLKNIDRIREYAKVHYVRTRHIKRAYDKVYYKNHADIISENSKCWKQNNSDKDYINELHYRMRKYTGTTKGQHTLVEWLELRDKTGGVCPACKKNVGVTHLSRDHIIPISCGGDDNISNIQPLCTACNSRKHKRIINYLS